MASANGVAVIDLAQLGPDKLALFPLTGYFKVFDAGGGTVYTSPVINDIAGGHVYEYYG